MQLGNHDFIQKHAIQMRVILYSTMEQLDVLSIRHACCWVSVLNRANTSLSVSCMRLFGLCSIRVALEESLTSRRRFATCFLGPKTNSERILILQVHTRSILLRGLVCPDSANRTRNAIIEGDIESRNVIELRGLLGRRGFHHV